MITKLPCLGLFLLHHLLMIPLGEVVGYLYETELKTHENV